MAIIFPCLASKFSKTTGMYARLICLCLWIQSVLSYTNCNLHSKFKEFDELTPDNFTVVVKRDALSGQVHLKIVTFFALRKYFVLHLVPGSPVLRKDFEAHMVDAEGRMTPFHVDQQIFYTGYLNDNPQHSVDAVHTDQVWLAQIHGPDDVYSIEPLTHHVPDSPTTSMLIFRQRDINSSIFMNHDKENATLQPFCEVVQFEQSPLSDYQANSQRSPSQKNISVKANLYKMKIRNNERVFHHSLPKNIFTKNLLSETHSPKGKHFKMPYLEDQGRQKRNYPVYDTCEILAIADFEIYKGIGRSNIFRMVSILVYLYQTVDGIYRNTSFGSFKNLGIVIANLFIHTEYTNLNNHYNMRNNTMSASKSLLSLSNIANFSNYCLVHLSTQRNLGHTVGIANTAAPGSSHWGGGICARYAEQSRNVGLSTPINLHSITLPVPTYLLVIAHEIGHNWGSHHDIPNVAECSPSSESGGKYLMWPYTADPDSPNSLKFSPCSRREVATILHAKAHLCFKPRELAEEVCGNNNVEPEEDCDVGYGINDPCCTSHCRFTDKAVCSPFNHPCCTNSCQIAPPTQTCFVDFQDCHETAFCSGTEFHTCPETPPLPNNSTCQSLGRCWQGKCVSFCELLGATFNPARRLVDCSCDKTRVTMCYHCCWDSENKQRCTKMGGSKIDGTPCMLGICEKGQCMSITTDDIFDKAEFSSGSNNIHPLGRLDAALLTFTASCLVSLTLVQFGQG